MKRIFRCATALFALSFALGWGLPAAHAADALNGKKIYQNGPPAGGAACARCHGASPAGNANNVLNGANNPGVISHAIDANLGGMGMFAGRLTTSDIADLAAFLANPNVTGAPAASVDPASLAFSATAVGQTAAPLTATLSNPGTAPLHIASLTFTGAAAGDYAAGSGTCASGATVAAGASCTVQVVFRPSAAGARDAALVIAHDGPGGASTVALSGAGAAAAQPTVALSANALDFGAVGGGATPPARSVTISNTGQTPLVFSAIGVSGPFTLGGSCATATPLPAGASCAVTVTASRAAGSAPKGALTIASNASNGTVTVALNGVAAAPALAASPSAVAFGARTVGGPAATQSVTLTNTGNVPLALGAVTVSGAAGITIASNGCGAALDVGASCAVTLAFAPASAAPVTATLNVASNAAPLQVAVSGSGTTAPAAAPALSEAGPLAFPDTQVGRTSAVHTLTFSNGGTAALKIASLALDGAQAADFVLGGSCAANATVGPSSSCTLDVAFRPTAAGRRGATLVLTTDGGAQFGVSLGGAGVAVPVPLVTATPQSLDFGSADVNGAASTRAITITNAGATSATVTAAAFSGPFAKEADGTGCANVPFTLAPGASCQLLVRFAPVGAGAASGGVALDTDAGARLNVAFTGVGAVPVVETRRNAGGGGCSAIEGGDDPVLAALVVLSIGVLGWRRFIRKQEGT